VEGMVAVFTRQNINEERLDGWCSELARRFPAITNFYKAVSPAFYKPVSDVGGYNSIRFQIPRCQRYPPFGVGLRETPALPQVSCGGLL
jgi:hypothetical protein